MINFNDLKRSKNSNIPTWDALASIILMIIGNNQPWQVNDIMTALVKAVNFPPTIIDATYPNKHINIIYNRLGWALSELYNAGLIQRVQRSTYQITPLGKQVAKQYGLKLDSKIIHAQPQYQQHQAEVNQRKSSINPEPLEALSLTEQLEQQVNSFNNGIAVDLLHRILKADPAFFERLVVKLLVTMGYQGTDGQAIVTQRANDGGIDGIINQDPLGTQRVYIQAKRYQIGNNVQRPAINAFFGAISIEHADRGVFITTSDFSQGAIAAAKQSNIILINGQQLTDLMLKYHVGVQVKETYQLMSIDEDFFDE